LPEQVANTAQRADAANSLVTSARREADVRLVVTSAASLTTNGGIVLCGAKSDGLLLTRQVKRAKLSTLITAVSRDI